MIISSFLRVRERRSKKLSLTQEHVIVVMCLTFESGCDSCSDRFFYKKNWLEFNLIWNKMCSPRLEKLQTDATDAFVLRFFKKCRKVTIKFKETRSKKEKKDSLESDKIQCRAYPQRLVDLLFRTIVCQNKLPIK